MQSQEVVAAPVPVTLDGVEYLLSPLTDADYQQMDNWVSLQIIGLARQSLGTDLSQRQRDETMRQAFETAVSSTWLSPLGIRLSATPDGIAKQLSLALLHRHPEMTFSRVRKFIMDRAIRESLMDAFDVAQGVAEPAEGGLPTNPTESRPAS